MSDSVFFKPRARLLLHLGEQLIRSETVAILELVKNAYDADAKKVTVSMKNLDNPNKATITVEDNGHGMDSSIIKNVWMEPGNDFKEKIIKQSKRSPLGRLPIGEKGIGRFGIHKLGHKIQLITKQLDKNEVLFNIDWKAFESADYLEDIKIDLFDREPEVFKENKTGTKIVIKNLKNQWNRGTIRELYRSLSALNSPFESVDSFNVEFKIDKKEWLKDLFTFDDVKKLALYEAEAFIENNEITKLVYAFNPWSNMSKISDRTVIRENLKIILTNKTVEGKNVALDLSNYKIGKVRLKLFIFDRDPFLLNMGMLNDKSGFKKYLDSNGGVRVFRDGMRVLDYGEPRNDWLGFGIRRINAPSSRLSNNIVIGAVYLDRESSRDLIEKTNREGFIENEAYISLREAITFAIGKIETERNIDKEKIRNHYGPNSKSEPIISNLSTLQDTVNKKVQDKDLRTEIITYLKRIESDYNHITEVYVRSAGAGLSLSIVVHEMEKIISELTKVIRKEKPTQRIVNLVNHLANLVEGYSSIVKTNQKGPQNLKNVIKQALFNVEFRIEEHEVEIIDSYSDYEGLANVICAKNLIIASIVNIIDNSIWWMEYANISNKKIYIGIQDFLEGFKAVVIADNGPGFSLPTDNIVKPFTSDKPEGMGMGLYITNEVMNGHGGKLLFPERSEIYLPPGFENGAITVLALKEEMT
jgi:signal transduction histidine kinase